MAAKCKPVGPGEWVQPTRKGYLLQCCDCGLVHSIDFKLQATNRGNKIQFRAFRLTTKGKRILPKHRPNHFSTSEGKR